MSTQGRAAEVGAGRMRDRRVLFTSKTLCPAPRLPNIHSKLAGAAVLALMVAGCTLTPDKEALSSSVEAPTDFARERLIGRWGVASFHDEKDRRRTESEARAQCGQAYAITKGPTDGIMMHVADDPKRYELRLKGDAAGRTYLGFEAPPGDPQDREILSSTADLMTMRFVDPDANRRYGTFVYVRCRA
ncbi:hypothetical protein ILT44_18555 [Microvirga sp. BT689]|uniref:hypothetical protein n=1 Tax=Microvirga arvi TaxID=2778731 RepID=UPI00194E5AF0|nr:hypothetical protein [Microvirga arvi]MBM6582208.1 hypothetical protein [Microvirga arvi]